MVLAPVARDAPLAEKVARLRDALVMADGFDDVGFRDIPGYEGRDGALMALKGVMNFLESIGLADAGQPKTLRRLVQALFDIDKGNTHPLTTPHIDHRPPATSRVLAGRAIAAVAMESLMISGEKKKAAASTVARTFQEDCCPSWLEKAPSASTVISWRDAVIGHFPTDAEGADYFRTVLALIRANGGTLAQQAQRALLLVTEFAKRPKEASPLSMSL
jgi:hypothetical protein